MHCAEGLAAPQDDLPQVVQIPTRAGLRLLVFGASRLLGHIRVRPLSRCSLKVAENWQPEHNAQVSDRFAARVWREPDRPFEDSLAPQLP